MGRWRSVEHLLVVWLLVGGSVFTLAAWTVRWVVEPSPPSTVPFTAGLVAATVVTVVGWVAGFRPSVRASIAYFLVEQSALLGATHLVSSAGGPRPVASLLSITTAGLLVFGGVGRWLIATARPSVRRLLRLQPPGS